MEAQQTDGLPAALGPFEQRLSGEARSLGRRGGVLRVLSGRVWLTRTGDAGDRVLVAGDSTTLTAGDDAWIGAWDFGVTTRIDWRPESAWNALRARLGRLASRAAERLLPAGGVAAGVAGAVAALTAGALLFGTLSDARLRELVGPAAAHGLHNPIAAARAAPPEDAPTDVGAAEPRGVAQQAGRRATGAA